MASRRSAFCPRKFNGDPIPAKAGRLKTKPDGLRYAQDAHWLSKLTIPGNCATSKAEDGIVMQDFETLNVAVENGVEIILRRSPRPGALRLLLSHGNGFAIGGYRKFWELLAPDFELCLFDLRITASTLARRLRGIPSRRWLRIMSRSANRSRMHFGARKTLGLFILSHRLRPSWRRATTASLGTASSCSIRR